MKMDLFLLGALSLARFGFGFAPEDAQAHHFLLEVLVLVAEEAVVSQLHHEAPRLHVPRVVLDVLGVLVAGQRRQQLDHLVVLRLHLAHRLTENSVAEAAHPLGVARGRLRQAHVLAAHPKISNKFYYNIRWEPFL
jgi:hypothetical protein